MKTDSIYDRCKSPSILHVFYNIYTHTYKSDLLIVSVILTLVCVRGVLCADWASKFFIIEKKRNKFGKFLKHVL